MTAIEKAKSQSWSVFFKGKESEIFCIITFIQTDTCYLWYQRKKTTTDYVSVHETTSVITLLRFWWAYPLYTEQNPECWVTQGGGISSPTLCSWTLLVTLICKSVCHVAVCDLCTKMGWWDNALVTHTLGASWLSCVTLWNLNIAARNKLDVFCWCEKFSVLKC